MNNINIDNFGKCITIYIFNSRNTLTISIQDTLTTPALKYSLGNGNKYHLYFHHIIHLDDK